MKKVLSFSIIVLCVAFTINAQDIVNLRMDRQQMGLRGYVASMDEDILLRKDYFREDWPQRKWFVSDLRNILREDNGRIVTFNQAGKMTSITYTHQGKAGLKTNCTYASNGLLSSFLGEGYKVVAKYKGNYADIDVFAETRAYAPSVNLPTANLNNAPYTNTYPFDLKCRQELTDDGLVLNSSYYYVDSMPAKVCVYNYNHLNQMTSERVEDYSSGEKRVSTVKYSYDNRGFLTSKTIHSAAVDETYTYENNDLGDCVKMTIERPYGTVVYTFEYVYDSLDNWTVRMQFENGVFESAAMRTLTYYKAPKEAKSKSDEDNEKSLAKEAKRAEKERIAAEKKAEKEAKAREKEEMKAQKERAKEAEKNLTKEERKALQEERKAAEKAAKEQAKLAKEAEKERLAAEKKAEKESKAAEKRAEKERKAAEKQAEKERKAAEKQAEKERKAAEKQAEKERKAAEKQAKK